MSLFLERASVSSSEKKPADRHFRDQRNVHHPISKLLKCDLVQKLNIFQGHSLQIFGPMKASIVTFKKFQPQRTLIPQWFLVMCLFCNFEINFAQFSKKWLQPFYTIPKYHRTVIPSMGTRSCDYDIS